MIMKRFRITLAVVTLLAFLGVCAMAIADSGQCGENVTWTLSDDHVLTISGSGPMEDYSYDNPWRQDHYDIESIVIEEGITRIGDSAFFQLINTKSISIPDSVTSIGKYALI